MPPSLPSGFSHHKWVAHQSHQNPKLRLSPPMDTASLRPGPHLYQKSWGTEILGPPSSLWFLSFCPRTLDPSILWTGSAPCLRSQSAGGVWAPRGWPLTAGWRSQLCPLCSSSPSCSQKWNHTLWKQGAGGDVSRCVSREKNKNRSRNPQQGRFMKLQGLWFIRCQDNWRRHI